MIQTVENSIYLTFQISILFRKFHREKAILLVTNYRRMLTIKTDLNIAKLDFFRFFRRFVSRLSFDESFT